MNAPSSPKRPAPAAPAPASPPKRRALAPGADAEEADDAPPSAGDVALAAMPLDTALPTPDAEQAAIIADVMRGRNVLVEACAGAGKTTTALLICAAWLAPGAAAAAAAAGAAAGAGVAVGTGASHRLPRDRVSIVSYSRALIDETRARCGSMLAALMDSRDATTIHSLMQRAYDVNCGDDEGLYSILREQAPLCGSWRTAPRNGCYILDEAQDLTPLRFAVLRKLLRDDEVLQKCPPQLVVFGDPLQTVYGFMGADSRFLTLADELFADGAGSEWSRRRLTTSYRLPLAMTEYASIVMHHRAVTINPSPARTEKGDFGAVVYCVGNQYDTAKFIARDICDNIASGKLLPSDFMILAHSTKGSLAAESDDLPTSREPKRGTPLQELVRWLDAKKVPLLIREQNPGSSRSAALATGKVLVTSFVGAKGLERSHVVVFGHDKFYFDRIAKFDVRTACPPVLHVAATRARNRVFFVAERVTGDHLDFLDHDELIALDRNVRRIRIAGTSVPPRLLSYAGGESDGEAGGGPGSEAGSEAARGIAGAFARYVASGGTEEASRTVVLKPDVSFTATSLADFVDAASLARLRGKLALTQRAPASFAVTLETTLKRGGSLTESVAEVNGHALPALFETLSRDPKVHRDIDDFSKAVVRAGDEIDARIEPADRLLRDFPFKSAPAPRTVDDVVRALPWVLEASALSRTLPTYRAPYVTHYTTLAGSGFNWVPGDVAAGVVARLAALVPEHARESTLFETPLKPRVVLVSARGKGQMVMVEGEADVLSTEQLVEIKCTAGPLTNVNFLQLAVYAWLDVAALSVAAPVPGAMDESGAPTAPRAPRRYVIFNALSGETWELDASRSNLDAVVRALLELKMSGRPPCDDAAFRAAARSVSADASLTPEAIDAAFTPPRVG
jgi:hypothetical protein